jgi:hypothetical protein
MGTLPVLDEDVVQDRIEPPEEGDGGGGGDPRGNWPLALAVAVVVLLAALLTYVGMLTQIWANLSGAQLPGA